MVVKGEKKVNLVSSVVAIVGGVFSLVALVLGGYTFLDYRYAKAVEHKSLEIRVSLTEIEDLRRDMLKELYFFRQQARENPNDYAIGDKLEEIKKELRDIEETRLALVKEKKSLGENL